MSSTPLFGKGSDMVHVPKPDAADELDINKIDPKEDIRMTGAELKSYLLKAQTKKLDELNEWFQQYGCEVHVSHVCPIDSTSCAEFHGRTQKAQQVHEHILGLIKELKSLIKEG